MSLAEYAASLRSTASGSGSVLLVSGNEASDADSVVTALLYAYYLSRKSPDKKPVAFVKCRREDIMLRNETVLLLSKCGVDSQSLIFSDDKEVPGLLERTTEVVLTDHNAADGPLIPLGDKVVEILDHHKDLGKHEQVKGDMRTIAFKDTAATAASACTVIAEKFMADAEGKQILQLDNGAVALALIGVILIDSINLDPKAKKVCPCDVDAVKMLSENIKELSTQDLYKQLEEAKFDAALWKKLSIQQCLRYDYKTFENAGKVVGLSSMLCPLEEVLAKEGWAAGMAEFGKELDLLGVLTNTKSHGRELAFIDTRHAGSAEKAGEFLGKYDNGLLQLESFEATAAPPAQSSECFGGLKRLVSGEKSQAESSTAAVSMVTYRQKNLGCSRKQVAPACQEFLATMSSL